MALPHLHLHDRTTAAHVRTQLAGEDLRARLVDRAQRQVRMLRDDGEQGSQTAEYAMVGGVGAAAAGALIYCISKEEVWRPVLESILGHMVGRFRTWF
jgi:hypothetical protein